MANMFYRIKEHAFWIVMGLYVILSIVIWSHV